LSPRDGKTAPEAQPGYTLMYHGTDIGVIERIDAQAADGSRALSVRGGISGSLRYTIPVAAVAAVDVTDRRVAVDDAVTFEPDSIARDGEVMLIAHTPDLGRRRAWRPSRRVPRASAGFRVYAGDGYLGAVETTLGGDPDDVDFVVVRVRHWRRTRHPVIPARRIVECEPLDGMIVVAGYRRELKLLPELPEFVHSPGLQPRRAISPLRMPESHLGTASVVVLCMGFSAGISLTVESVWKWLPWTLVTCAIALGALLAQLAGRGNRDSDASHNGVARPSDARDHIKKTD
jgi:hypothetical protein